MSPTTRPRLLPLERRVATPNAWWRAAAGDPIDRLDLSHRAHGVLIATGRGEVRDLVACDLEELAARRGIGTETLDELATVQEVLETRERGVERAELEATLYHRPPPLRRHSWKVVARMRSRSLEVGSSLES